MSKYPDISHHDPVKDWARVKKTCPFLISKATQGTSYIDTTLISFIKGCEKNKIPYWLYTYLNKGNELEQAKFLVKTCKSKVGKYFIGYVIDVEAGNSSVGVKKALDYITGIGCKTMIYTMYSDYQVYKSIIDKRPDSCAWWEARYGKNDGYYSSKFPCHKNVDLHQYTDNGKCDGITGTCDLNRIVSKGEKWFMTPVENKKKSITEIAKEVISGKWGNGEERKKKLTAAGYDYKAVQNKVNELL